MVKQARRIPPPMEMIEDYHMALAAMRLLELIPEGRISKPFDDGITEAFNNLDDCLGAVAWIDDAIEEARDVEDENR